MGWFLSKLSYFWTPHGYDDPDPSTGLTLRQIDHVQKTWGVIRKDCKKNGVKMFIMLFDAHPEYQKLFSAFADTPRAELPDSKRLMAHAMSVMYAINSVVDNLKDPECLIELLVHTGVSHRPRKVSSQHFTNLSEVIIQLLKEECGPSQMNEAATQAWQKTLGVANSIIINSLENK